MGRSKATPTSSHGEDEVTEDDAWRALERLDEMDAKFGVGCGASKERAKLNMIITQWEQAEAAKQQEENNAFIEDYDNEETDNVYWDDTKFVAKHLPTDAVALFGGDPARRRQSVEKKLSPFASLDQFGTPRDVGPSDTANLLKRISAGKYHVVYLWTRFNCHASRGAIRQACMNTGTRFEEVESLAYIRKP